MDRKYVLPLKILVAEITYLLAGLYIYTLPYRYCVTLDNRTAVHGSETKLLPNASCPHHVSKLEKIPTSSMGHVAFQ